MTDYRSERKEKLSEEHLHGDDESNVVCIDKHLFLPAWIRNDEELPLITVHSPSKIFHGVSKGIGDAQNEVNVETSSIRQPVLKRKSRKRRTGLHDGEARSLSAIRRLRKRVSEISEILADSTSPTGFTLTINSKDEYLDRDWGRGLGEGLATNASLTALTLSINSKDEYLDRDLGRYPGKSLVKSSSLTAFNLTINSKHRYLGGDWGKGLGEGLAKSTSEEFCSFYLCRGVCESSRSLDSESQKFSKYPTKLTERKIKKCTVPPCPDTRNERMRKECTKKCGDEIFVGKDENLPEVLS